MPYIMNWVTGFQWESTNNLLTEVQYQGNAGVGLLNNWDINVVPLNEASDSATLDNIRRNLQNFASICLANSARTRLCPTTRR